MIQALFSHVGYYLILLLFLCWIFTLLGCLRHRKPDIKPFLKSSWLGLSVSLILCAVIFTSIEPMFRVLNDETNLLSVSKTMTYEKRTDNITMGKWYYDTFHPIKRVVEKRPLLFPFLAHIVHALLGYRATNVFILNFFVLFFLLFLVYTLIKREMGDAWASSGVLLVAAQPIVSQTATSGGFDLLAALFLIVSFMSLRWFLEDPKPIRFQLLWTSLLMLANARHESILTFLIAICLLAFFKYIKMGIFKNGKGFVYFCTPFILCLTLWQRLLVKDPFENKDVAAFSIQYFIENNVRFFKTLFDYRLFLPYATIVNFIGFLGILYLGCLFILKRLAKEKNKRHLAFISTACLAANWILYTSFFRGQLDHPANNRYFVIFFVLLSVFALMSINRLKILRERPAYIIILSILAFVLYHPVSVQDRFSRTQTLPRRYRFTMDFLKKESAEKRNFLVITNVPGEYTVHNYGAVDFKYANEDKSVITGYKNHLFENIYVIQDIEYKDMRPTEETAMDKRFILETLAEMQNKANVFTRISKVASIAEE